MDERGLIILDSIGDDQMDLKQALNESVYQSWKSVEETQYAVVDKGEEVLIAFQGTIGWKDWLLNFYCLPYKDMEQPFYVHAGFLKQYKNVRDIILKAVKDKKRVDLRGHSLGGALSLLAHEDIRFHYPDIQIVTVTFGAPKVLVKLANWKLFEERLQSRKKEGDISYFSFVINVINGNDIVPKLPLWPYIRIGTIKNIGEEKKWYKFSIKQHMIKSYLENL